MNPQLTGIHHVTAITGDAQSNIDFYGQLLGLRLVKVTVNFDDPGSYHLYYGDMQGRPGTAMTFFVWNGSRKGRVGYPQAVATSFAVPAASLPYWRARLEEENVPVKEEAPRFGEPVLSFPDPDDMRTELIGTNQPVQHQPLKVPDLEPPVPSTHAIQGFHSVTLQHNGPSSTGDLLNEIMGFTYQDIEDNRRRYATPQGAQGSIVDILEDESAIRGGIGTGTIHHVAFRAPDDAHQKNWQSTLTQAGYRVSDVMDRCYFHSIYFKEPSGFLFEIATDGPGFTADEPIEKLGTALQLPPWMESDRERIKALLPPIRLPAWQIPS